MAARGVTAIEFFSGIGAFAYACRRFPIEIVAAFDQGQDANRVYEDNFGHRPRSRNLDSISVQEIPDADIWWMSPPCTPYTVRGAQRDDADHRAESLKNLIRLLSDKRPAVIFVENVLAFAESQMFDLLTKTLRCLGYSVTIRPLCPTQLGIPMKRPRLFVIACRENYRVVDLDDAPIEKIFLRSFISETPDEQLEVASSLLHQYGSGMHVVDSTNEDEYAICFTSGYGKSFRASGSFINQSGLIRRFSPEEMLCLFGFEQDFRFPPDLDVQTRWRLIGNSVDVRSIRRMLMSVERVTDWVEMLPE